MPDRGEASLDHDVLIRAADRWRARRQLDGGKVEQQCFAVSLSAGENELLRALQISYESERSDEARAPPTYGRQG